MEGPHLPLRLGPIGNYIMPTNPFQPIPLLQAIFISQHHLYHQHLQLRLKCSPYPKTTVFKTFTHPAIFSFLPPLLINLSAKCLETSQTWMSSVNLIWDVQPSQAVKMSSFTVEQKSHPLPIAHPQNNVYFCFLLIKNYHYDTCLLCYCGFIFCILTICLSLSVFWLAYQAHERASPATQTQAHWQLYNAN